MTKSAFLNLIRFKCNDEMYVAKPD